MSKYSTKTVRWCKDDVEVWCEVEGWENFYEVSSFGRVRSLPRIVPMCDGRVYRVAGKILNISTDRAYCLVTLCRSGKETTYLLHRLVLVAFEGPCPEGMEGCHKDGNTANNKASNLKWDTHTKNQRDIIKHGNTVAGVHGNSYKITGRENELIEMYKKNDCTIEEIARRFGITTAAVYYHIRKAKAKRNYR